MRIGLFAMAWLLVVGPGAAAIVTWTGEGVVTSVGGFSDLALEPGATVQFAFSYDDSAEMTPIEAFGFFSRVEYRNGIDLEATVGVGAWTWRGTLASGAPGNPTTLEIADFTPDLGTADLWLVTIPRSEGAEFPVFAGGDGDAMTFTFRDDEVPLDFIGSVTLFAPLLNLEGITEASGLVRSQTGDSFSYIIDPATVEVTEEVARIALRSVAFADGQVTLVWEAELDFSYTIFWSDSLEEDTWFEVTTVIAENEEESFSFAPVGGSRAQFYRIVQN